MYCLEYDHSINVKVTTMKNQTSEKRKKNKASKHTRQALFSYLGAAKIQRIIAVLILHGNGCV